MAKITIASATGLFTAFDVTSPLQGNWRVEMAVNAGTFQFGDGTLAQDLIGLPRQSFRLHWPMLTATEYNNLLTAIKAGPLWYVWMPETWDNVNPAASPNPQYWICIFAQNALNVPFENRPPSPNAVADVTLTLTETGRGP